MAENERTCLRCGEVGHHFKPPSMGKFGYYVCEEKPELTDEVPRVA